MSRMTLKVLDRNGDVTTAKKFPNAWLFQPFVWTMLCERYGIEEASIFGWPKLWKFAGDGEPLEWFEWNTLVFGYDHVVVKKGDLALLIESLRAFHSEYGAKSPHNHCPALADSIESMAGDIEGAAIYGTSVSEDLWHIYDADDNDRPYNINVDDGHEFATLKQKPTMEQQP